MSGEDTVDLLERSLGGEMEALNSLLEEYRPYLLQVARDKLDSAVKPRLDASDIVQQTCLEVHRDFASFQGTEEGQFIAWMKQILNNNVANAFRDHVQVKKRTTDKERPINDGRDSSQAVATPIAARQSTPSARAIRTEAQVELRQNLEQLPEDQREAVRLRHLEGWSLRQLAEHFGRSEVAVAGLLKRGMKKLRRDLTEE